MALKNDLVLAMRRRYGDLDDVSLNQIGREFDVAPSTLIQMVKREGDWHRDWIDHQLKVIRQVLTMLDGMVQELEQEYANLRAKYQRRTRQEGSARRAG